ncbi:MAG: hypothetical protein CVU05_03475 [Bacteroidetes bacterium HGW-Bacteroidetes-21]|nr:MAG: hypothetical protein CVU05_03475 [Bacteroidetes bacterium HGW-Bacteroidetes-21]
MQFTEFGLNENILKAIGELGFETPTAIQEKVIPVFLQGESDIIGLAQTGTGKTAAFGLPLIQMVDSESRNVQAVIISPTRELCMQITSDLQNYSKYFPNMAITPVYGGASIDKQHRELRQGSQIIVATPGRLVDFLNRGYIKLKSLKYLVLDEADEMLNMGFREDLDFILSTMPESRTTLLFSATMPNEVASIAKNYMKETVELSTGTRNTTAENIEHQYYVVNAGTRFEVLRRILDFHPGIYGLIFCRTRQETQEVAEKLLEADYNAEALHGDLSQQVRDSVMRKFRSKSLNILVATDVAARGIDVDSISHVINYNLPDEPEQYIHRSGRTGRAGKAGISISLVSTRETNRLMRLQQLTKKKFVQVTIPSGFDICEKQLLDMIDKMMVVDLTEVEKAKFMPDILNSLSLFTREEVIMRMVAVNFSEFLKFYSKAKDLNDQKKIKNRYKDEESGGFVPGASMSRFFINFGTKDNINKSALVRLICENAGVSNNQLGRIDMRYEYSFFEVEEGMSAKVLKGLKAAQLDGRPVTVGPAEQRAGDEGGGRGSDRRKSGRPEGRFKDSGRHSDSKPRFKTDRSKSRSSEGGGWSNNSDKKAPFRKDRDKDKSFSKKNKYKDKKKD